MSYIEKTDGSEKVNNFESGKYDKNKTAGKFVNYFNSMGSFLKSITNIRYIFDGENSRDTLYISEYSLDFIASIFACGVSIPHRIYSTSL